jgi:hypothetical protein
MGRETLFRMLKENDRRSMIDLLRIHMMWEGREDSIQDVKGECYLLRAHTTWEIIPNMALANRLPSGSGATNLAPATDSKPVSRGALRRA